MDIFSLELDIVISEYLVDKLEIIFKHIHPNIITIFGIVLNYYIYIFLNSEEKNIITSEQFYLCMFCRWISDCLDGAIARKFNKGSKLGHYLDTISDVILGFIFIYFIQKNIFNYSFNFTLISYIVFIFIFNYFTSFISTHDNIKNKQESDNILYKIISLFVNNTYLYFILIIVLYNYYFV